ncbi:MAG TPA: PLP-dependent lyase/thiolase [Gaiellaceae bacterium]|jgi:threonine dehydratase|nr:PLP-dependent lyase/thiolase [Gaiellaceae bacterium]
MGRATAFGRDDVYLKREDEHELGAFKWRGAVAVLDARKPSVVVTASTGNHGAATAWAAKRAGVRAVVFVPEGASASKVALIEAQGAELHYVGTDVDEAKAAARAYAAEEGAFFFEDGAEPAQFEGYEAIGRELLEDIPEPGSVVVPVGNGALAIGVFRAVAAGAPQALRVAVAAAEAPAMWESYEAGRPVDSERCATFADGLAVRVSIPVAVEELNRLTQRFELVSEDELEDAVRAYAHGGIRAEGAAAAALALALREELPRPVVLIVTGRNIDDALYDRILSDEP